MTKEGASQEGLIVEERLSRVKHRSEHKGWYKSRKSSKKERCFKYNEVEYFKHDYSLGKKYKRERERTDSLSAVTDSEKKNFFLMVSEGSAICRGSEMTAVAGEEQQEVQQGSVGQLTSFSVLSFIYALERLDI